MRGDFANTMIPLLTVFSALIPSVLLVWFFKSRDAHPEPSRALWATFGLGAASIVPTIMVEIPVGNLLHTLMADSPLALGFADAFFGAALPEEFFKMGVVLLYCLRLDAFDEPMDGVIYSVVAALGFATLENVFYVMQYGLGNALMRAVSAVPMHALCGAIMGYFIARWRFPAGAKDNPASRGGTGTLVLAFAIPAMLHGLYDGPLLAVKHMVAANSSKPLTESQSLVVLFGIGVVLVVFVGEVILGLMLVARLRKEQRALIASGAYRPVATPPPLPAPPSPSGMGTTAPAGTAVSWTMIAVGFLLASAAGMIALGIGVELAVRPEETRELLIGGAVLVLPPLAVGLLLFILGLRKLPQTTPRISPFVASSKELTPTLP